MANILVQQTARLLLTKETDKVRHLLEEGIIQPREADTLLSSIHADYVKLDAVRYEQYTDTITTTVHNRLTEVNGLRGSSTSFIEDVNIRNDL